MIFFKQKIIPYQAKSGKMTVQVKSIILWINKNKMYLVMQVDISFLRNLLNIWSKSTAQRMEQLNYLKNGAKVLLKEWSKNIVQKTLNYKITLFLFIC